MTVLGVHSRGRQTEKDTIATSLLHGAVDQVAPWSEHGGVRANWSPQCSTSLKLGSKPSSTQCPNFVLSPTSVRVTAN